MRKLTRTRMIASLALALFGSYSVSAQAEESTPGTVRLVDHHVEGQVIKESHGQPVIVDSNQHNYTWKQNERGGNVKFYTGPATPHKRAPSPTYVWATGRGSRSFPPGYGYTRIVKYKYEADGIPYLRILPQYYYGDSRLKYGPQYPMVYTPTDTTQLGYYYQHVPHWQPRPNMIPTAPWPAHWHHRTAPLGHSNQYTTHAHQHGVIYESNTAPTEEGTLVPTPAKPTPDSDAPPKPPVDKVENDSTI